MAPDKSTLLAGGGGRAVASEISCRAGGRSCALLSGIGRGALFLCGLEVIMDTLAEWLRRRPAKPMGSPRVGSSPTGVACTDVGGTLSSMRQIAAARE